MPVLPVTVVGSTVTEFRRPFQKLFRFDVRTGVLLLAVFGLVRVVLVLQASATGQYQAVSVVFVAMAALPWIVLTRPGRRRIGIVRPTRWGWVLPGALLGAAASVLVAVLFAGLWGTSIEHPFVYIGGTYSNVPAGISDLDRVIYFTIFAVIGMTFSPIGEEMLYRGIAQESFASRLGGAKAALIDAGAFAVVHLAHFGVVYVAGAWAFLPGPALVWLAAMFGASLLFHAFRVLTGSILGAVASHAGFNLAMTAVIFFGLGLF